MLCYTFPIPYCSCLNIPTQWGPHFQWTGMNVNCRIYRNMVVYFGNEAHILFMTSASSHVGYLKISKKYHILWSYCKVCVHGFESHQVCGLERLLSCHADLWTSVQSAGVAPGVNMRITQVTKHTRDPPWLWNPGQTSVVSWKGLMSSKNFK